MPHISLAERVSSGASAREPTGGDNPANTARPATRLPERRAQRLGGGSPRPAKRRRQHPPQTSGSPIWMRPPAWLYLPHLGCGGGTSDVATQSPVPVEGDGSSAASGLAPARGAGADAEATLGNPSVGLVLDEGDGTGMHGGGGPRAAIRGRGEAPGRADNAGGASAADAPIARAARLGEIRGQRTMPGAEERAREAETRRQARHSAETARRGLTRFFEDIAQESAQRARIRSTSGDQQQPRHSAAERMAALRRRIVERAAAQSTPVGGAAVLTPVTGGEESNDDYTIHLGAVAGADGGRAATASGGRGGGPVQNQPRGGVAAEGRSTDAAAAAASHVAWHSVAAAWGD